MFPGTGRIRALGSGMARRNVACDCPKDSPDKGEAGNCLVAISLQGRGLQCESVYMLDEPERRDTRVFDFGSRMAGDIFRRCEESKYM